MGRVTVIAAVLATLVASAAAAPGPGGGGLFVGFSEDLPKELGVAAVTPAADVGATAFRLTTLWAPGQTALTPEEEARLDRATAAAAGLRVVLSVYSAAGANAPQTAAARTAYCEFVRDVLSSYPSIRDVVIWNEPNKSLFWSPQSGAGAAYEELLARCYDALPDAVNVIGLALSSTGNDNAGSTSPGEFIRNVGAAYRMSGRAAPLFDTVAHHPYGQTASERPWRRHIASKTIALGDWNKLMANLALAFDGTGQPLPGEGGVTIWYTEAGSQTSVDGRPGYTGTENVTTVPDSTGVVEPSSPPPAETSPAPDQATQTLDAIRLAACQPHVTAYFNFLLADEPRLEGWQSGAYWSDLTAKESWPAFRQAIAEASAGTVDCDVLKGGRPSDDYTAPLTPADVTAEALTGPLRVQVSWAAPSDEASALSYRVYRNGAHVGTTAETTWTNVTVSPETFYRYTVRALDAAGNLGAESQAATLTTPETVAPTQPGAPVATVSDEPPRVTLWWAPASDVGGVAGYEVLRDEVPVATVTTTTYTDAAVEPGATYAYAVVAFDVAGNRSRASDAAVVTLPADDEPPPAPEPPPPAATPSGGALPPDLSVSLATTPALPRAGAPVDVLVRVSAAASGGSATSVSLRIELPAGAGILGPPAFERGSGCTGAAAIACDLGYLPNGASTPVRFSFRTTSAGRVVAIVSSAADDAAPSDNVAAVDVDEAEPKALPPQPRTNRAPTAPTRLRAIVVGKRLLLSWRTSRDDHGVRAYLVYRDGQLRRRVRRLRASEPLLRGRHVYVVRAVDAAGLRSRPTWIVVRRR